MSEAWTINYEPSGGGRLAGKLTVDDEWVTFVALYDASNAVIFKSITNGLINLGGLDGDWISVDDDAHGVKLRLPRSEIATTTTKKTMLAKRIIVTMNSGEEFVFNYGMLSVAKLAEDIES